MNGSTLHVQITWAGRDGFLIDASDPFGRPIPTRELAFILFAFDEKSFFGTNVTIVERNFKEYIVLSPLAAMHYFSKPGYNDLVPIEWPSDWLSLQKTAQAIRHGLETANFTLDGAKGLTGELVWKLVSVGLPCSTDTSESVNLPGSADASEAPSFPVLTYFSDWVNAAVWDMIATSPEVEHAFKAVMENHPALAGELEHEAEADTDTLLAFMDEEEWKIAIGLKQDDMPFTFAIQLVDPYTNEGEAEAGGKDIDSEKAVSGVGSASATETESVLSELEEEDWLLHIVLQDKSDPMQQIYLPNEIDEYADSVQLDGGPLGIAPPDAMPLAWIPYLNRVNRKIAQCIHLVPWLAEPIGDAVSEPSRGPDDAPELKSHLTSDEALLFLEEASVRMAESGISVYVPSWWEDMRRTAVKMKASVKSASSTASGTGRKPLFGLAQTVDFDWRIAIGDVEMSEAEFLRLVAQKKKLVLFRGRFIRVDSEEFRAIAARMKKTKTGKGLTLRDVFELHLLGGSAVDLSPRNRLEDGLEEIDPLRVTMEVELDNTLVCLMTRLTHTKEIPTVQVPDAFQGKLRPYQQIGVSWLTFLRTYGLGACLADDMGLGKTIQYIAYLLVAREANGVGQVGTEQAHDASLLICPTSVIGNWQKEIARFAPSLRVYVHYGSRRSHGEEFANRIHEADVVLTSYTLAQMDEEDFTSVTFDSICLDEAQNIKNPHTKQAQSIRKFEAIHRIAMTGTPIENRLTELWSIFDFLNPGYLGSLHGFQEHFVTPIERHQDAVKLEQIKRLVHPLLLRRVKQDPAIQLDLPEKVESKVYVSLTPEQAALYENIVGEMLSKLDKLTGIERSGIILTTLLKLKQICNHPVNFLKTGDVVGDEERSNKLTRLVEMVSELREEGDSCLIFTQFVEMGQLLKEALTKSLDEKVLFLHGSLSKSQRDTVINEFQAGEAGIFILSLKAGGVGLNLTAASHVFHFDRWWNPAVENQATDRAFRIGQTKRVEVHKFVTLGTLEERIDEMIDQKQMLSNQIVGGGESWITQMSTNELRDLFVLRREWVDMDT